MAEGVLKEQHQVGGHPYAHCRHLARGAGREGRSTSHRGVGEAPTRRLRPPRGPTLPSLPLCACRLVKRCDKPDRKDFLKVATKTGGGFVVFGLIGFVVKVLFIPINRVRRRGVVWRGAWLQQKGLHLQEGGSLAGCAKPALAVLEPTPLTPASASAAPACRLSSPLEGRHDKLLQLPQLPSRRRRRHTLLRPQPRTRSSALLSLLRHKKAFSKPELTLARFTNCPFNR